MSIIKPSKWIVSSILLCLLTICNLCKATTIDLTSHLQSTVVPAGATLEWHNGLPVGAGNLVSNPTAVSPGVYYAVYNYGGLCYSQPTPIRLTTNTCPSITVNLSDFVDSTKKPNGASITYHNAQPISAANQISESSIAAGTYYVAYLNTIGCYTMESVIVVVDSGCTSPSILKTNLTAHVSPVNVLPPGTTIVWLDSVGNTILDPTNVPPGLYSGIFDFGNGCFSEPSQLRIATNICPETNVNIKNYVDSTNKPLNTIVSYHSGVPASLSNMITSAQASAVDSGTYYTAYYEPNEQCFTNENVIIVVKTECIGFPLGTDNTDFNIQKLNNCKVYVSWKTNSETEIAGYTLLRKNESENHYMEKVKVVAKNNVGNNSYNFTDTDVKEGMNMYQLQTSFKNGNVKSSLIRVVNINCSQENVVVIYPNPTSDYLNVAIEPNTADTYTLSLLDISGKLVYKHTEKVLAQKKSFKIDLSMLSSGMYTLLVSGTETDKSVFKVIKH
jgi:hypothetical protein